MSEMSSHIKASWQKSMRILRMFLALHAIENLLLCVPMAILKHLSWTRAEMMEEKYFYLLPQEQESILIVDGILFSSIAFYAFILPILIQLPLGLAYFKFGHAWSRILVREVSVFPWDEIKDGEERKEESEEAA